MSQRPARQGHPGQFIASYILALRDLSGDAQLFLIAGALFTLGINSFFLIYNLYILELGYNPATVGRISAATVLGLALAGIPSGYLVDRTRPKTVALLSIGFTIVTQTLRSILTTEAGLLIAAFVDGFSFTLFWVAGPALIAELTSSQNRSLVFSLNGLIGSLIGIPANLLSGGLPQVYRRFYGLSLLQGERLTLLSMMIFLPPAIGVLARVRPPVPTRPSERNSERYATPVTPAPRVIFIQIAIITALMGLADGLFFPFGNVYFKQQYGFDTDRVGYVAAISQIVVVGLFLMVPPLTRRWKKTHILAAARLIALPFVGVLALGLPAWLAWPSYALAHVVFPVTMAISDNVIVDIVPNALRARATGVRSLCLSLGAVIANTSGGWLIATRGYQLPILGSVTLGALLVACLLAFFARRELSPGRWPRTPARWDRKRDLALSQVHGPSSTNKSTFFKTGAPFVIGKTMPPAMRIFRRQPGSWYSTAWSVLRLRVPS